MIYVFFISKAFFWIEIIIKNISIGRRIVLVNSIDFRIVFSKYSYDNRIRYYNNCILSDIIYHNRF